MASTTGSSTRGTRRGKSRIRPPFSQQTFSPTLFPTGMPALPADDSSGEEQEHASPAPEGTRPLRVERRYSTEVLRYKPRLARPRDLPPPPAWIEAAWFAQGEQLPPTSGDAHPSSTDERHTALEQHARELEPHLFRRYALDLR